MNTIKKRNIRRKEVLDDNEDFVYEVKQDNDGLLEVLWTDREYAKNFNWFSAHVYRLWIMFIFGIEVEIVSFIECN